MSVFLKTFYTATKKPNGKLDIKFEMNANWWKTMHVYMKILKRYYTLYNVLIESASVLEDQVNQITENTRF